MHQPAKCININTHAKALRFTPAAVPATAWRPAAIIPAFPRTALLQFLVAQAFVPGDSEPLMAPPAAAIFARQKCGTNN